LRDITRIPVFPKAGVLDSNSQYGFYLIARASRLGYCLKSTEVDCAVTSLDGVGFEPISMGFIH
jgi:hypothetical protein